MVVLRNSAGYLEGNSHSHTPPVVMLIPAVGFGELQRVLGQGKLEQILFRSRPLEQ